MNKWQQKIARAAELLELDAHGRKTNKLEVALVIEREFNCTTRTAWEVVIRVRRADIRQAASKRSK